MAIRKRNKPKENKIPEKINPNDNKPKFGLDVSKTWKDEAIDILNILEKDYGVNIYDENNTPGMYLKSKKEDIPISLKRKLTFSTQPKEPIVNKTENSQNNTQLNNLFTFFNNQSKK